MITVDMSSTNSATITVNVKTIPNNVVQWMRWKLGLNQKQFAKKLGISQPYLARIEGEHKIPNWKFLLRMREKIKGFQFTPPYFGFMSKVDPQKYPPSK